MGLPSALTSFLINTQGSAALTLPQSAKPPYRLTAGTRGVRLSVHNVNYSNECSGPRLKYGRRRNPCTKGVGEARAQSPHGTITYCLRTPFRGKGVSRERLSSSKVVYSRSNSSKMQVGNLWGAHQRRPVPRRYLSSEYEDKGGYRLKIQIMTQDDPTNDLG